MALDQDRERQLGRFIRPAGKSLEELTIAQVGGDSLAEDRTQSSVRRQWSRSIAIGVSLESASSDGTIIMRPDGPDGSRFSDKMTTTGASPRVCGSSAIPPWH